MPHPQAQLRMKTTMLLAYLATLGLHSLLLATLLYRALYQGAWGLAMFIVVLLSLGQIGLLAPVKKIRSSRCVVAAAGLFAFQVLVIRWELKQQLDWVDTGVGVVFLFLLGVLADRSISSGNRQPLIQTSPASADKDGTVAQYPVRHTVFAAATHATLRQIRYVAKPSEIYFRDICGMEELKARLNKAVRAIVAPLHGQRQGRTQRNGILLFGEPGNGKTLFAEAIAGEIGLPLITVTYGDVASKWINETTENVMHAVRDAVVQAPCVLFFDEIDSLIRDRNAQKESEESPKTTNSLLTALVDLRDKGVVIMGATNHLERLDGAAIREGRFDFKIEVPPPDEAARREILWSSIEQHVPHLYFVGDCVESLARRWEGFSVRRLQAVVEALAELDEEVPMEVASLREFFIALRRVQGRKGRVPESTKVLDDLVLASPLREQLRNIAYRMRDIERFEKYGGTVPSGLLFFGPPGTGKTETARALAKETGWAFLSTSGNDIIADPNEIDRLVREARDIRPCIIFIDEAEGVLADRMTSATSAITNKLLTMMDGVHGRAKDLLYIAATNYPDRIDPAALRGGRLSEKVHFCTPNREALTAFINDWIFRSPARFGGCATPAAIAMVIGNGASIPDATAILQEAVNRVIGRASDSAPLIALADVSAAKKTVLRM